ncbi:MAG: tRNA pseudouridine(13) synthase TruD [Candidatus Absconditabacterales bacterium]|nr:tRNA pseudouridine(13) synthase TruD [Candidatus Absconditabacterales bacterium]
MFFVKTQHQDFIVTEHLAIPTTNSQSSSMNYFCVRITKPIMNTKDFVTYLAKILGVSAYLIGFAGLKDKHARCHQYFSFGPTILAKTRGYKALLALLSEYNLFWKHPCWIAQSLSPKTPITNEFSVLLQSDQHYTAHQCNERKKILTDKGFPNVYGDQRFGWTGHNHLHGKKLLDKLPKKLSFDDRFKIQARVSSIANALITKRWNQGRIIHLAGDDTPLTVPVPGADLRLADPATPAGKRERMHLKALGIDPDTPIRNDDIGLWGRRREVVAYPQIQAFYPKARGYLLRCILPKGSYLTSLVSHLNTLVASTTYTTDAIKSTNQHTKRQKHNPYLPRKTQTTRASHYHQHTSSPTKKSSRSSSF